MTWDSVTARCSVPSTVTSSLRRLSIAIRPLGAHLLLDADVDREQLERAMVRVWQQRGNVRGHFAVIASLNAQPGVLQISASLLVLDTVTKEGPRAEATAR